MGLKALKVDAAYVKGMAAAGYPELRANKLTSMKAVGVSPEKGPGGCGRWDIRRHKRN